METREPGPGGARRGQPPRARPAGAGRAAADRPQPHSPAGRAAPSAPAPAGRDGPRPPPRAAARATPAPVAPERLQKFLAAAGCGSRREIEALIEAGRVVVNGQPATPGQKVGAEDRITIDGKPCYTARATTQAPRVIAVHKPADVVCTRRDPEGRPTVFDLLPSGVRRWIMVGRLDLTTSGVVLFTDDGELAHRLMHPSYNVPRHYAVRVLGDVDASGLAAMRKGIEIDGEVLKFDALAPRGGSGVNQWYECELHTGRNREVRRLWEHLGLVVSRLIRIRFGPIGLPRNVPAGRWFEVTGAALEDLYALVGLEAPPPPPPAREPRPGTRRPGQARRQGRLGRRAN